MDQARAGALVIILALAWAVAGAYAVHGQMPRNVLRLPFEAQVKPHLAYLVPEGWAFFTRDPREPKLYTFSLSQDGRWENANQGPHALPQNVFGLDRRSRAQGVEIALILGTVRANALRQCREAVATCLESLDPIPMRNASPAPTLCGDIGIAQQEPLPWAWYAGRHDVTMPGQVVRLVLSC